VHISEYGSENGILPALTVQISEFCPKSGSVVQSSDFCSEK